MAYQSSPTLDSEARSARTGNPLTSSDDAMRSGIAEHESSNLHQCHYCSNWYARPDHLKRHVRSHDNARTYKCRLCSRGFNRKDLLDRHQTVHERCDAAPGQTSIRKHRTAKACQQCACAKTKCWGGFPCSRCRRRGDSCLFDSILEGADPAWSLPTQTNSDSQGSQSSTQQRLSEPHLLETTNFVSSDPARSPAYGSRSSLYQELVHGDAHLTTSRIIHSGTNLNEESDYLFNDIMADLDSLSEIDLFYPPPAQTFPDFETMFEIHQAPEYATKEFPNDPVDPTAAKHTFSQPQTRSGHEAFQRSSWLWAPTRNESASLEESPRLTDSEAHLLTISPVAVEMERFQQCTSKHCRRDALLLLVQQNTESAMNVASFPSSASLDMLLQLFLYRQMTSPCPFVHVPSFDPGGCRTELLAAMVSSMASCSRNSVISKMGLALQEKARTALWKAMYHDNCLPRNIEIMQAMLLWIETGLWSGVPRKMEVAESVSNNVPTMIRRAGVLPRSCYPDGLTVSQDDEGDTLRQRWLKWVRAESFKRTVLRAFTNDVQGCIAYLRTPCFHVADIDFELPASQALWEARNPEAWRNLILSKRLKAPATPVSLLEIADDPTMLASAAAVYDFKLSALVALHCMWIQVASFLDSRALLRSEHLPARKGHSLLWLEAQRQDLYQKVKQAQCVMKQLQVSSAVNVMICEYLAMSLFASPFEIQKAAGRFGEDQARVALSTLQAGMKMKSDIHRYAIWHAGQVIRAADNMMANSLYGFYAIPVYQAFLTVLTVSIMARSTLSPLATLHQEGHSVLPCADGSSTATPVPVVILNGEQNADLDTYLLTGHGNPALKVTGEASLLSSIDAIPSTMKAVFAKNHEGNNTLPPMLDDLLALVENLSTTTWDF